MTAFPLLARLLRDAGIERSKVGSLALSSAAVGDVGAWCLLAAVVGATRGTPGDGPRMLAQAAALLALVWVGATPLARLLLGWLASGRVSAARGVALLTVAVAAWAAEAVGLHALFGGFAVGVALSRRGVRAHALAGRSEHMVTAGLLPVFFAVTGLRTAIGLLVDSRSWLLCVLIVTVASVSKMAGVFVGGRAAGFSSRESTALACLMNTRGLVGLVILNVGLDIGLIAPALFTMLVVMDIVTTVMTGPLVRVFVRDPSWGLTPPRA